MKPLRAKVLDVIHEMPSLTFIVYEAKYLRHTRRGAIAYDRILHKICTHNSDIQLLAMVFTDLRNIYNRNEK